MRAAIDIGGTCTDFVLESGHRHFAYKYPTIPDDLVAGVLNGLEEISASQGCSLSSLLGGLSTIVHGTTVATNALLTGEVARTALLTTEGHRDIMVLREAGRFGLPLFDHGIPNPEPFIERALTFEIPERVDAGGAVVRDLDEAKVVEVAERLVAEGIEAVAVCFLWSIANPCHELRVESLLRQHAPGLQVSLSHRVNPCVREYRRASSTCIDAALKPLVGEYVECLREALRENGFHGELWLGTSEGTILPAERISPIHQVRSGPALGPVAAARALAEERAGASLALLVDAGGTTFDVSLLREGRAARSQETWIGRPWLGHMTGFPSVDVRSVGAGGGSIARLEGGRLLRVGPQSAGAFPGPASYGRGGGDATLTDASVVLGFQDLSRFIGIRHEESRARAEEVIARAVAEPLDIGVERAAEAMFQVFLEECVAAISEMSVEQGVDPRGAWLIATGGSAGIAAGALARRLGCGPVLFPPTAAVNCAAGGLLSDISQRFSLTRPVLGGEVDETLVGELAADLEAQCARFARELRVLPRDLRIDFSVVAKYHNQSWEIEVPFRPDRHRTREALAALFHAEHERRYHHRDPDSEVAFITWQALAVLPRTATRASLVTPTEARPCTRRRVRFPGERTCEVDVLGASALAPGHVREGPLIVETPLTTIVVDPESSITASESGALIIRYYRVSPFQSRIIRPNGHQPLTGKAHRL